LSPFFIGVSIILMMGVFATLFCVFRRPNILDKVLVVNLIGTNALVILILISYISNRGACLDVALAYALLSFIAIVVFARYIESRGKF